MHTLDNRAVLGQEQTRTQIKKERHMRKHKQGWIKGYMDKKELHMLREEEFVT